MTADSRGIRVLRGFLLAGFSTFVAAFSHAAGGGQFPHPMLIVAGVLFSGIFCAALAGRASWARIVPSVLVSQAGFHLLFSVSGSSGAELASVSGSSGAELADTGAHAGHGAAHLPAAASTGHAMLPGDPMLAAHAAAAIVTVLAVRFGETALRRVADAARLVITTLLRLPRVVVTDAAPARVTAASAPIAAPLRPEFLVSVDHRGPPVVAARSIR